MLVREIPALVSLAFLGIPNIAVRKGFVFGSLAGFGPLALGTNTLAAFGAMHLRLIKVLHDHGTLAFFVGKLIAVDTKAKLSGGACTDGWLLDFLADVQVVLRCMPLLKTLNLKFWAVGAVHEHHVAGAGFGAWGGFLFGLGFRG